MHWDSMIWRIAQFVNKYTTLIYKGFYAQLVYVGSDEVQLDGRCQQTRRDTHAEWSGACK